MTKESPGILPGPDVNVSKTGIMRRNAPLRHSGRPARNAVDTYALPPDILQHPAAAFPVT